MIDRLAVEGMVFEDGQALVGQELAQVEGRLGLADGIEIDQPGLFAIENELGVGKIAVAEAERHGRVILGVFEDFFHPGAQLVA